MPSGSGPRAAAVCAAALLCVAALQGAQGAGASHEALAADVEHLVRNAHAALQAGLPQQALDGFEQAAARQHAAAIEIGIVRAQMQLGEYRRAVAFASHAAAAHADEPEAAALYAELLRRGGQADAAQRWLDAALKRAPADAALERMRNALVVHGEPGAWAPAALGEPVAPDAMVIGQATLAPDALHAWVPLALLAALPPRVAQVQSAQPAAPALWLRNGLGDTVRAERVAADAAHGVALLRLTSPLPAARGAVLAPREPFAGVPVHTVAFDAQPASAHAAWPRLSVGFVGAPISDATRWLGVDAGAHSAGAPVFDRQGRLAGMVLPAVGADARLRSAGVGVLAALLPMSPATAPAGEPPAQRSVDEVYEQGLRSALQVIARP